MIRMFAHVASSPAVASAPGPQYKRCGRLCRACRWTRRVELHTTHSHLQHEPTIGCVRGVEDLAVQPPPAELCADLLQGLLADRGQERTEGGSVTVPRRAGGTCNPAT